MIFGVNYSQISFVRRSDERLRWYSGEEKSSDTSHIAAGDPHA
jgi:hypothetical protein